jgi:hypothetical protein
MRAWLSITALTLFAGIPAPAAGPPESRSAIADAEAELARQERAARNEATLAVARLELVLAQQALLKQEFERAARQAQRALDLIRDLPPEVDARKEKTQGQALLARAAQAGIQPTQPTTSASSSQGRHAASTTREKAPASDQGQLETARQNSHIRALVEVEQTGLIPPREVNYPDNWLEIVARRRAYAGGLIARSESWWDDAGREWYVAIYDIEDLLLEPAYFPAPIAHPGWAAIALADRQALRDQSDIFRGSPEDLAAGLPLLRFFGGFYDVDLRPRRSLSEQRRIITMIRALTQRPTDGPQVRALDDWGQ